MLAFFALTGAPLTPFPKQEKPFGVCWLWRNEDTVACHPAARVPQMSKRFRMIDDNRRLMVMHISHDSPAYTNGDGRRQGGVRGLGGTNVACMCVTLKMSRSVCWMKTEVEETMWLSGLRA